MGRTRDALGRPMTKRFLLVEAESFNHLGGNNSSEVRVWLGGETRLEPYPNIGNLVAELEPSRQAHYGPGNTAEIYEDDRRIALCRATENLTLFLGWRVNQVEVAGGVIRGVTAQEITAARRVRLAGRWFADCTGDGDVGYRAGADHDITLKQHMGPTNVWNVKDTGRPTTFPRCPWALRLDDKPFPGRGEHAGQFAGPGISSLGGWFWESGFDRDPIADGERIRDWNFRAMYGAWDTLKNVDHAYETHELNFAAHIAGKRESRRLLGDLVLTRVDHLESGREAVRSRPPTSDDVLGRPPGRLPILAAWRQARGENKCVTGPENPAN